MIIKWNLSKFNNFSNSKESFSSSDCSNTDKSFSDNEKPKKKNPKKKKTLISDDEVSNLATESVGNTKKRVRYLLTIYIYNGIFKE